MFRYCRGWLEVGTLNEIHGNNNPVQTNSLENGSLVPGPRRLQSMSVIFQEPTPKKQPVPQPNLPQRIEFET